MISTPGKGKEVMFIGGTRAGHKVTDTLIYNLGTNAWRKGPAIPYSAITDTVRYLAANCGLILD